MTGRSAGRWATGRRRARPSRATAPAGLVAVALLLAGCTGTSNSGETGSTRSATAGPTAAGEASGPGAPGSLAAPTTREVATDLDVPWGLAFLPDGGALVSERDTGRILRLHGTDPPRELTRLADVAARGEGGLLGIAVAPTYPQDGLVYAYYTTGRDNRIVRFRAGQLGELPQPIVTGIPAGSIHNGGRIAFGPDGLLYAGTGESGNRSLAQNLSSLGGKILRVRPDGSVPDGNPFPGSPVYSLGHRNVQGLAWDGQGRLYATEFGQNRFDEINRIEPGRNYGWPAVEGRAAEPDPRFTEPLLTWPTDVASPSGAAIVGGTLYVAALRGERLWRVPLTGDGGVGDPRPLLVGGYGRLRTVAAAADGALWLTTSNRDRRGDPRPGDDRIIAIRPPPTSARTGPRTSAEGS